MSVQRSEATVGDQLALAPASPANTAEELRTLLTRVLETQCRLAQAAAGVIYLDGSSNRRAGVFARWPQRTNMLDDVAMDKLERLGAQTLAGEGDRGRIESLTIADRSGLYGAGQTHIVLVAPLSASGKVEGAAMLVMPAGEEIDAERALTQLSLSSAPFETFLWRQQAMAETWGSTCHGAGRVQSRHAAKRMLKGVDVARRLAERGIYVRAQNRGLLAEEASEAYKDVAQVVEVLHQAGISRKVARMRPIGVVKG